ncbi:MAG TPA: hypothetical protein VHT68_19175 [Pseudolabrys sp.]|nr:hypothetical protein [Pseudolabrys sp.]
MTNHTVQTVLVDRALKLIRPKREQLAECRECVETVVRDVAALAAEDNIARANHNTKRARDAAKKLAIALKRADDALENMNLPAEFKMFFPRVELRKWLDKARTAEKKAKPTGKARLNIDDGMGGTFQFTRRKTALTHETEARAKRKAVVEAHSLLLQFSAEKEKVSPAKGSSFCKLAAALYGDPGADLQNQCREALRKRRVIK